jgi:hypothetical protein
MERQGKRKRVVLGSLCRVFKTKERGREKREYAFFGMHQEESWYIEYIYTNTHTRRRV